MISRERTAATILALIVWTLAGALFGALFVALRELLIVIGLPDWQPIVIAATLAAMTTAAFYSAMSVALIGVTAGVLASIGYLMISGQVVDLPMIAGIATGFGLLAGFLFGWGTHSNTRALGVTLTGALAGVGAGLVMAIVMDLTAPPVGSLVLAAGVVALVGALFQLNEQWLTQASRGRLSVLVGGPLVAALVAAIVSVSVWLMVGSSNLPFDLQAPDTLDRLLRDVPSGLTGGLLGGAITGLILELLGFHLEDHKNT